MATHHTTIQRLAFAKYLYSMAVEQSRLPEIQAAASLLPFHDSIEFFLQIASEHLNAGKQGASFLEYWELLSPKLGGVDLPQKESMRRLNKARVNLKHAGTLPSKLDVESFRASATQFFTEATPLIFQLEFGELSLIEYISRESVKEHLKNATRLSSEGDYDAAAVEVAIAYETLIDEFFSDSAQVQTRNRYSFGKKLGYVTASSLGIRGEGTRGIAAFVDAVKVSIDELQGAVRILALGINYQKYARFRSLLPPVAKRMGDSTYVRQQVVRSPYAPKPDADYIDFCVNFVVECAIRLEEST